MSLNLSHLFSIGFSICFFVVVCLWAKHEQVLLVYICVFAWYLAVVGWSVHPISFASVVCLVCGVQIIHEVAPAGERRESYLVLLFTAVSGCLYMGLFFL